MDTRKYFRFFFASMALPCLVVLRLQARRVWVLTLRCCRSLGHRVAVAVSFLHGYCVLLVSVERAAVVPAPSAV
jgi:hypothetical protein